MTNSTSGTKSGQSSHLSPAKERRTSMRTSASVLGSGHTPFYANSGQHPRRLLARPRQDGPDPAQCPGRVRQTLRGGPRASWPRNSRGAGAAARAAGQAKGGARFSPAGLRRRAARRGPGDEARVLLDTGHTPLPSRSLPGFPALNAPLPSSRVLR